MFNSVEPVVVNGGLTPNLVGQLYLFSSRIETSGPVHIFKEASVQGSCVVDLDLQNRCQKAYQIHIDGTKLDMT